MKHFYRIISISFFNVIIIPQINYAQKQNTYSFSLKTAQEYAIKHNYNAIKSKKDIEKTSQQIWEIIAGGLPKITAKIDYKNFIEQAGSLVPASAFDPTPKIIQAAKEYFGLNPSKKYTPSSEYINMRFGQPQTLDASITITQKLFNGEDIVALQSIETIKNIAKYAESKTILSIKEAVMNSYGGVLISKENLKILEKQKENTLKNLQDTKVSLENGFIEKENVEQLELSLNDVENQIDKAQQQVKTAINLFKYILGIDIYTPNDIEFEDEIETFITSSIEFDTMLVNDDLDYSQLIDYKIQENTVKSNELLLKSEKLKYLPSLSAFLTYSKIGNNNDLDFFKKDVIWQTSALLGVSLNIPIFSSFKRYAKIQQAKIDLDKSNIDLFETKNKLKLDYDNAKIDYNFAQKQFYNANKNMKLSQYILKKTNEKFNLGTTSSFELLDAYNQVSLRQQKYLQSLSELIKTKAKLYKILNL